MTIQTRLIWVIEWNELYSKDKFKTEIVRVPVFLASNKPDIFYFTQNLCIIKSEVKFNHKEGVWFNYYVQRPFETTFIFFLTTGYFF